MRGGGRVDGKAFGITDIGQVAKELLTVYEGFACFKAALDTEANQGPEAVMHVFFCQFVGGVRSETRIDYPVHIFVIFKVFCHCHCIVTVAFHSESKGFNTLDDLEAVERRYAGPHVPQQNGAAPDNIGRIQDSVTPDNTAVGRVRVGEHRELARGGPVEPAAVNDDSAYAGAMAATELGQGMD